MNTAENFISYSSKNSYTTLNQCTAKTKNVWFVFHGIGYLSRFFLKYFNELNPEENYIIAPQAPSKYYLNNEYRHVGASWLTKEVTAMEMDNLLNYLDAVYNKEVIPAACNLIILGYSQGVSVAMRWVAKRKIPCQQLVLYAGGIPEELIFDDFEFLGKSARVKVIVGNSDEYLTAARMEIEQQKIGKLFPENAELFTFTGKHEIKKTIINSLV